MAFDPSQFKDPDGGAPMASPSQSGSSFNPQAFKDPDSVPPPPPMSATSAALEGLKSSIADTVLGATQAGIRMQQMNPFLAFGDRKGQIMGQAAGDTQHLKQVSDTSYEAAKAEHPIATQAGYLAGLVGQGLAVPSSRAESIGGKIGEAALQGADIGGLQYVQDNSGGSGIANMLMGGGIGAIAGGIAPAYNKVKEFVGGSPKLAAEEIGKHVAKADVSKAQNAMSAADRSGIHLTPGEATGNKVLQGEEGRINMTLGMQHGVEDVVNTRNTKVLSMAKQLTDDLVPEGKQAAASAVNKLYEKSYSAGIPKSVMDDLKQYPQFQDTMRSISKNLGPSAPKEGTVGYLDAAKRYLDGEMSKLKTGGGSKTLEYQALKDLKGKIVSAATDASPEYSKATSGAQKLIVQRKLEDKLAKVMDEYGDASPQAIRKAWFGNKVNSDKFFNDIQSVTDDPTVVQRAKDLQTILNRLGGSKYEKLLSKNTTEMAKQEVTKGEKNFVTLQLHKAVFGRRDKAVLDLISNPKWQDELNKLATSKMSDQELGTKFINLMGRLTNVSATSSNEN